MFFVGIRGTGAKILRPSEFLPSFDESDCNACGVCEDRCPVDAITINHATGAKEVDAGLCVGCKVCTIACPYGTVNYEIASGKVVKCDLCGGDPQCAEACPTGAIVYGQAAAAVTD